MQVYCKQLMIMATTTLRKTTSFRFPPFLLETLKRYARENNSSMNSFVVGVLSDAFCEHPNPVTMAAIKEAREGKSAGVADTSSLDAFIKSCSE